MSNFNSLPGAWPEPLPSAQRSTLQNFNLLGLPDDLQLRISDFLEPKDRVNYGIATTPFIQDMLAKEEVRKALVAAKRAKVARASVLAVMGIKNEHDPFRFTDDNLAALYTYLKDKTPSKEFVEQFSRLALKFYDLGNVMGKYERSEMLEKYRKRPFFSDIHLKMGRVIEMFRQDNDTRAMFRFCVLLLISLRKYYNSPNVRRPWYKLYRRSTFQNEISQAVLDGYRFLQMNPHEAFFIQRYLMSPPNPDNIFVHHLVNFDAVTVPPYVVEVVEIMKRAAKLVDQNKGSMNWELYESQIVTTGGAMRKRTSRRRKSTRRRRTTVRKSTRRKRTKRKSTSRKRKSTRRKRTVRHK